MTSVAWKRDAPVSGDAAHEPEGVNAANGVEDIHEQHQ